MYASVTFVELLRVLMLPRAPQMAVSLFSCDVAGLEHFLDPWAGRHPVLLCDNPQPCDCDQHKHHTAVWFTGHRVEINPFRGEASTTYEKREKFPAMMLPVREQLARARTVSDVDDEYATQRHVPLILRTRAPFPKPGELPLRSATHSMRCGNSSGHAQAVDRILSPLVQGPERTHTERLGPHSCSEVFWGFEMFLTFITITSAKGSPL